MGKAKDVSNRSVAGWYLFMPGIGHARHWQGEPLPAPSVEDLDKIKLGAFLKDFAGAFLDEVTRAGGLRLSSLWCGGRVRALLAPRTPRWLESITEKKAELENLEQTAREWAPERYAQVASEWQRFRPAGHMLVMEAQPVYLGDEEAQMQADANEMFRDGYGDSGVQPQLTEATEPAADDPDRWYVIIGWLKLAGLDGFRCAERDGLNSNAEEVGLAGTAEAESPDRQRAQVLVKIHQSVAPELSTGAWFDLKDVRRACAQGGKWHERFTGVERLGSHLNFLWCNVPIGIVGPYFLPRVKGIVARLSEGRHTYRQAIAESAKELGVEVRSLMLFFRVQSPSLAEHGNNEPKRLREWFENATRGISPLCDLYWEDSWGGEGPLARIAHPERWRRDIICDGHWLGESPI